jgi:hypothetical protein
MIAGRLGRDEFLNNGAPCLGATFVFGSWLSFVQKAKAAAIAFRD